MLISLLLFTVSHTGQESIIVRVTFTAVISYRCNNILFHPGYSLSSAVTSSRGHTLVVSLSGGKQSVNSHVYIAAA